MTNKLTSKLVSIILTVAICLTTVFGCLVTVSAENTASYVITGAQCIEGDTLASAIVEFSVPQGIAGGRFTIDNTNGWYESVAVTPYGDITESTDIVDVTTEGSNVVFNITDDNGDAISYAIVAFKLDFVFSSPISDDIEITISDVDLNGIYTNENYSSFANNSTNALFSAGCQHKFAPVGEPVYSSTDPEYTVYSQAICSVCGEGKSDYQVVPSVESDDGIVELWDGRDETGKWIGYQYGTFSGGTGKEDDPYIIKYSEQLAYLTTASASTYAETVGKYYKIDDSIKAFNMNTTGLDLSGKMTAQEVYDLLNNEVVNRVYWSTAVFAGNLDGNGVEIYGLHTGHMDYIESGVSKTTEQVAGLFPKVAAGAVIKNIVIKNSYMYTNSTSAYAGGIVGGVYNDAATNGSTADTVYMENCVVHDCYIGSKNATVAPGVIAGYAADVAFLNVSNVLVYDNEVSNAKNTTKSIVGNASKWVYVDEAQTTKGTYNRVINSVILDAAPYDANGSWWFKACDQKVFQNVYFDNTIAPSGFGNYGNANSKLTQLASVDNAKGSAAITNMPDLDWNTNENPDGIWFAGNAGQYPTLLKAPKAAVADSSDFGWKLLGVNLTYKNDGGFAINFHYLPKYNSDVALYVTNASKNANTKVLTNSTESSLAGTVLPAGAKMFTLDNLSARDISVLWLATIVTTSADSSTVVYSETKQISIGDYAEDVVLGDAFYDQNASSSEKTLDKTVAAALINYASASEGALSTSNATSNEGEVVIFSGAASSARPVELLDPSNPVNSESNPYIIELPVQLLALSRGVLKNTNDEEVSAGGYYYKVKDGIKAFVMQGVDAATANTIMSLSSTDEVNAYFAGAATKTTYWGLLDSSKTFNGHFDGNGVEIYGIYSSGQATALFTQVSGTSSIKNLTLKNSYISANSGAGVAAIVGKTPNDTNVDTVVIENLVVANNYIEQTGNQVVGANALVGMGNSNTNSSSAAERDAIKVYNCLVYDNKLVNNAYTGNTLKSGLVGDCTGLLEIKNVIALGVTPWTLNAGGWYLKQINDGSIANVYTDASQADWDAYAAYNSNNTAANATKHNINYALDADSFKGSAAKQTASVLDWETIWSVGDKGKYPSIVLTDAKVKPTSSYTGTPDTSLEGLGTEASPFIITSADEFAAVALGKVASADSAGNSYYFKVADGVTAFYINGGAQLAAMTNVADVKAYLTSKSVLNWTTSGSFNGKFDGNNVTVYGVYSNNAQAGLFPKVDKDASIKNVSLKNSYLTSTESNQNQYAVGGLIGLAAWRNDSVWGIIEVKNCIVANNYIRSLNTDASYGRAGAIAGNVYSNSISITDCGIYNNEVVNGSGTTSYGPCLVSYASGGSTAFKNIISIGTNPYTAGGGWHLRANQKFTNVYTDGAVTTADGAPENYTTITKVTKEQVQGDSAEDTLANFAWDTVWFTGKYSEYPSFTPAGSMPSNIQSQYDGVSFDITDALGNGTQYHENGTMSFGVYQTALSLKANPYMSFAFAFHGDYKTNRDKIKIRFTYTENGATKTSDAISVPAYTGADIKNVNGWTNTSANGRYHTYRAESIPVEALAYGIKVEASYNGGAWVDFGTYSASGLGQEFERLNRNNPSEYYETRVEAVKALLFYAQAIAARYGA